MIVLIFYLLACFILKIVRQILMTRAVSSYYKFINCSFTRMFVLKCKSADYALYISAITKSTTTTTTTTTTTATTTPTSTSTSMATVLHISTTTSATNTTTITTTPANTQTLPSTDTSESNVSQISISTSLTTIVSTAEGKSSFFLVSGWAIIAGTGGGLTTLVAIILVWWNCKPCCLCPVCVSRFVS